MCCSVIAAGQGRRSFDGAAGFTLLEVLTVVAVVAILVALAVPAIRGSSKRAQDAVSLGKARECLALILSTGASADRYPMGRLGGPLIDPMGVPTAFVELPNGDARYFPWFGHDTSWNWVLMALGVPPSGVWVSPSRNYESFGELDSDYALTHAVMASRAHWQVNGEQSPSMWGGQLFAAVERPANKVIVFEIRRALMGRVSGAYQPTMKRPMAFADGHGDMLAVGDAQPGVFNRFTQSAEALLSTRDGVAGWDY